MFYDSKRENEYSDIYHVFRASEFVEELIKEKKIILNEDELKRVFEYVVAYDKFEFVLNTDKYLILIYPSSIDKSIYIQAFDKKNNEISFDKKQLFEVLDKYEFKDIERLSVDE